MSASNMPVLEAHALRKVYRLRGGGEIVAVKNVSLELRAGRSLAIVGESGSGKTSIARMLVGLERPTSGSILVEGRDRSTPSRRTRERRERGREVQIIFQDPYTSLDPHQTVGECVDEVLRLHFALPHEGRCERVQVLLEQVGLHEAVRTARPRGLSGGQRQRVAIARALAAEPRLLVLDEAVSALDVSIQAQVLNLLADIQEETGTAFVLISHDLAVVRQLSDETLVLHHGEVVERGPTDLVLDEPHEDYTRRLRRSVPAPGWRPVRSGRRAESPRTPGTSPSRYSSHPPGSRREPGPDS